MDKLPFPVLVAACFNLKALTLPLKPEIVKVMLSFLVSCSLLPL